jgi:hypothetical protein
MPRLLVAVACRRLEVEAHDHLPAAGAWVGGGKIAVDAAADVLALRAYTNGLAHFETAVPMDRDRAVVGEDALIGPCGGRHAADAGQRQ